MRNEHTGQIPEGAISSNLKSRAELFLNRDQNESGFLVLDALLPKMGTKVIVGGVAIGAALGLGIVDRIQNPFSIEESYELNFGKGKLNKISMEVPEDCRWKFETTVTGASAKKTIELEVGGFGLGSVPGVGNLVSPDWKETFNGDLTNKPCNNKATMVPEVVFENNEAFVTINLEPSVNDKGETLPVFVNTVYRTNPLANEFNSDVDLLGGQLDAAQSIVDGLNIANLDILDPKLKDGIHNGLQGLALMAAIKLSAEACGPVAWQVARQLYSDSLKQDWINQNTPVFEGAGITIDEQNVTVNVPEKVTMTHQYAKLFKSAVKDNKDVDISLPSDKNLQCDADREEVTIEDATQ